MDKTMEFIFVSFVLYSCWNNEGVAKKAGIRIHFVEIIPLSTFLCDSPREAVQWVWPDQAAQLVLILHLIFSYKCSDDAVTSQGMKQADQEKHRNILCADSPWETQMHNCR